MGSSGILPLEILEVSIFQVFFMICGSFGLRDTRELNEAAGS
jgi:hypothetical protein